MKILAVSDEEEPSLYDYFNPQKTKDVELILGAGDLHAAYLEFLTTMVNQPLFYVHGNHDKAPDPEGCTCIDNRVVNFHGLRIAGLDGCMNYNNTGYMYSESEMERKIKRLRHSIKKAGGVDILLTHAPCRGYGDREDLAHRGFACFNDFLNEYHPVVLFHGHVHKEYGDFQREILHPSGTRIINAYGYIILDVEPKPSTPSKPLKLFRNH